MFPLDSENPGRELWGTPPSIFCKGTGCCSAVHVGVVDIVDIRIGGGDIVIIVGVIVGMLLS